MIDFEIERYYYAYLTFILSRNAGKLFHMEQFELNVNVCKIRAWPSGGIGRRRGLKILCPQGRAGSSPASASYLSF